MNSSVRTNAIIDKTNTTNKLIDLFDNWTMN